ncbi:hypothetical protein BD626DRAFT_33149 [Schizophyllum amplum]|uniref:Fungal-type protein kinase domain-containing protein n=1 Tax=Schizophyllum amplum TaxID=97359 RepID=A0A550CE80_9AGAR|nr:hypothetical protein BD626DRAFT_33149 [Auriculariopsis ampla]
MSSGPAEESYALPNPRDLEDRPPSPPRTPPNQSIPLQDGSHGRSDPSAAFVKQTPRIVSSHRNPQNVTDLRSDEIPKQMSTEMNHCGLEEFMAHYMPFSPDSRALDEAVNLLKGKGLLVSGGDDIDWDWGGSSERERYKYLVQVSAELVKLKIPNRNATCQLVQSPDNYMDSQKPGANFKIDARFALIALETSKVSERLTLDDAAVTAEYKLLLKDQLQNWKQLVSGVVYIMNADPRRTHIFSFSIEDNMMTVWFFSRSHSCRSATFDMRKHYRRCIEIFIAFMFATPAELGFDETVELISTDGQWYYGYKVGDRYYRTERSIFEHNGTRISGRGTRVWEVVRIKDFKDPKPLDVERRKTYALKDVWLDKGALTERKIQEALFGDLDDVYRRIKANDAGIRDVLKGFDKETRTALQDCVADRKLYGKYFLTIDHDWEGPESKPRAAHAVAVPNVFGFGYEPSPLVASVTGSDSTRARPNPLAPPLTPPTPVVLEREFVPKYHYRVVFDEVGEALHYVDNISLVLRAVLDCLFALQLLFLARWVHRDISTGNLLWWNGRGLLADLEYAKKFEPKTNGSSDPKTGTAFFMAVEIQKQRLIYQPPDVDYDSLTDALARSSARSRPSTSVVVHNYEHDLESIFWVLLWIYMARLPHSSVTPSKAERHTRSKDVDAMIIDGVESTQSQRLVFPDPVLRVVREIFQNHSGCSDLRYDVLTSGDRFEEHITPLFEPEVATVFLFLAVKLCKGYKMREFDFMNAATYSPLYTTFRQAIQALQAHYGKHPDSYLPLLVIKARETIQPVGRATTAPPAAPRQVVRPHAVPKRRKPKDDDDYEDEPASKVAKVGTVQTASRASG